MKQEQKQAATFENVWALLEKHALEMEKSSVKFEQSRADFDRKMAESNAGFERELKESRADFDRKMAESNARFERELKESRADFDRRMAESNAGFERELKESRADFDHRMKKLEKLTGSWANNYGSFAEEYFFNSFEHGKQNFFGETFDVIEPNKRHHWQDLKDEYDIVLYNHTSIALIEVKFKAHIDDIPKVIKKPETFRLFFPHYKDFKIYLGLASMSFYRALEDECINQGIAVIKQVGDKVIMYDKHLKAF